MHAFKIFSYDCNCSTVTDKHKIHNSVFWTELVSLLGIISYVFMGQIIQTNSFTAIYKSCNLYFKALDIKVH